MLGKEITFGVPVWIADLAFLVAFGLVAIRRAWAAADRWPGRAIAALGFGAGTWVAAAPDVMAGTSPWLWTGALVAAALLGMPIFALFGGLAAVLFLVQGDSPANVIIGGYDQLTSTDLPAIVLFALAGCLLAEGRAPDRLLRFFRGWAGWMPGGTAVVTVLLCAFFTLLTGGSGITILAVGGVLLPTLLADGYREPFSHGLLVSSGSLGILFPPSLPLILYGIVATVSIRDLFVGGLLPGALMIIALALLAIREGLTVRRARQSFQWREALAASWDAKWEILLPFVIVLSLLGGATTVQSSAMAALFALVAQRFVHRDVRDWRGLQRVTSGSLSVVGGVLIILAVAVGFTNYLIDAQVPARIVEWTTANVQSKWVFLLGLNAFLIVVGGMMDIFSTIIIVVPLIVPIAAHFQVDPVHLGVIFAANAELGYLTPPVGENLFVASQRFGRPLLQLARDALPMYIVILIGTLLVTYVPWFTLALVDLLR
jgi:tripartite ATP-independent transporter DctM subunit